MKHRILSLVLAVTMLLGTAGFAFAADGNPDNLDEEILALQAKIDAIELQIDQLTEKDPTTAELTALKAELAELEWYHNEAVEGLELANMNVKNVKLALKGDTIKVTWTAGPKVQDYATKYRVRIYKNGQMCETHFVPQGTYEFTASDMTRGCKYSVFVAPVKEYKEKNYAGIAIKTNVEFAKMGAAKLQVVKNGKNSVLKATDLNTTGYQVMVSKNKFFKTHTKKVKYVTNEKALNKKVVTKNYFPKGTSYVRVRTYTKINGVTYFGLWSNKVKVVR